MPERTILNPEYPATQTPQAVAVLLAFCKRPSEPMPAFVELAGGVRLTRSKKGDCYYTTTATDCSCKAWTFNPSQKCKHMKALEASQAMQESREQAKAYQARERAIKGKASAVDSIRERQAFKPIAPDEAKVAPSVPLYIDMHDTSPAEVSYFERKEAVEFLPAEA